MADMVKVLDLVNSARAAQGLNSISVLPKGVKEDGRNCPLARGLNGAVYRIDGDVIELGELTEEQLEKWVIAWGLEEDFNMEHLEDVGMLGTPQELADFIEEFDDGKYPELVEEKKDETNTYFHKRTGQNQCC